uniref:Uncharacterized protein n=1 Tax=Rhizophora mucronata TaxID=61149 RepID=A0A2P2N3U1_RHIMU
MAFGSTSLQKSCRAATIVIPVPPTFLSLSIIIVIPSQLITSDISNCDLEDISFGQLFCFLYPLFFDT